MAYLETDGFAHYFQPDDPNATGGGGGGTVFLSGGKVGTPYPDGSSGEVLRSGRRGDAVLGKTGTPESGRA